MNLPTGVGSGAWRRFSAATTASSRRGCWRASACTWSWPRATSSRGSATTASSTTTSCAASSARTCRAYAYQFGVVFWNLPFYVALPDRPARQRRRLRRACPDRRRPRSPIASTAAVVAIFYVSLAADPRARAARRAGRDPPDRLRLAALLLRDLPAGPEARVRRTPRLGAGVAAAPVDDSSLRPRAWRFSIGLVLALLISVRYANIVLLAGVVYVFFRRRVALPGVRGRRLGNGRSDRDPRAPARAGDSVRFSPEHRPPQAGPRGPSAGR